MIFLWSGFTLESGIRYTRRASAYTVLISADACVITCVIKIIEVYELLELNFITFILIFF